MSEVQGAPPTATRNPGIGIAGFVCSLVGLFIPGLGLIGLILSIVGYRQAKRYGMAKGLSITGIVLGAITIFIFLAILAAIGAFECPWP
jgi:membrane-bound ClpP family serine protease